MLEEGAQAATVLLFCFTAHGVKNAQQKYSSCGSSYVMVKPALMTSSLTLHIKQLYESMQAIQEEQHDKYFRNQKICFC